MKQRLLLALLMLLTSAGFMKAQVPIDITVPASEKEQEVKVTIETTGAFKSPSGADPGSFPLINGSTPSVTPSSAVYSIKSKGGDFHIATTYIADWKNMSIRIEGPISVFKVGAVDNTSKVTDTPFLDHVTSISIIDQGGNLASLKLGTYANLFDYFPNLTSFTCPNHRLSTIPAKANNMENYDLGTVDLSNVELKNKGAANNFQFAVADLNFSGITSNLININDLTITNLRDKDGNALTEQVIVSQPKDVANGYWVFKNASGIYMDGTYTANIEVASTNKSYPGLVFGNVT